MAGSSLNLFNLKPPKPPAPVKTPGMPAAPKSGFPVMGASGATPKVKKPVVSKTKAKSPTTTPSLVTSPGTGLAGALAKKNLV